MKKKIISFVLCAVLCFSNGGILSAGAASSGDVKGSDDATAEPVNNKNEFTGEAISLSLQEAVNTMKTKGYLAQRAEIYKKTDEAVAKGYRESAHKIDHYLDQMDSLPLSAAYQLQEEGITKTNLDMVRVQQKFAQANINSNYEAEMNSIEQTTVELYYGVIQAQENVRVCQENLSVQTALLKNIQQKLSSGKATKLEVSSQQSAVISAEQSVKEAEDQLSKAKMKFNTLLGYDVTQTVNYTDSLTLLDMPKIDLTKAIQEAIDNRLDYKQLQMTYEMYNIYYKSMRVQYGETNYNYLSAEATLLMIKLNIDTMPKNMEAEIRGLYRDLQTNDQAIESAKSTLALAEEALRVKKLLYESGLTTFTEVQKAQIAVYQVNQLLTAKMVAFDLATYEWKYATGVGTKRIEL